MRRRLLFSTTALLTFFLLGARPAVTLVPFTSTLAPYRIGYPRGWTHTPLQFGTLRIDAFLRPVRHHGFTDNINVLRLKVAAPIHDDAGLLHSTIVAVQAQFHVTVKEVGLVHLGTHQLHLIQWSEFSPTGQRLVVMQAVLYRLGWGWAFTLTAVPEDAAPLKPVFMPVVRSFHAL